LDRSFLDGIFMVSSKSELLLRGLIFAISLDLEPIATKLYLIASVRGHELGDC
jgi:hypothetical protein